MNRPTLPQCRDAISAFAARELPEDWFISVDPVYVGHAHLTAITLFWEGREANSVPREAHLVFGLDQRLLWVTVIDPGMFLHATEEGFGMEAADQMATRRLASFEDVYAYLRGQAYHLADCA